MKRLLAVAEETTSSAFAALVGNPPYQEELSTKETQGDVPAKNVFHHYQTLADGVSKLTSLIYPGARWLHASGRGLQKFSEEQLASPTLKKVVYFPQDESPFKREVGVIGGVTAVLKDCEKPSREWRYFIYEESSLHEVPVSSHGPLPLTVAHQTLLEKVFALGSPSLRERYEIKQKLFGVESNFAEVHASELLPLSDPPPGEGWVKLLTNHKAGKGGRVNWYWCPLKLIPRNHHLVKQWKVVISSVNATGVNGHSPLAEVLDDSSAFGRSRVAIGFFATKEEAENFLKWLSTPLIRTLLATTGDLIGTLGSNTPVLKDYSSSSQEVSFKGTVEDLQAALCELYGVTISEREYTEGYASKLAPLLGY